MASSSFLPFTAEDAYASRTSASRRTLYEAARVDVGAPSLFPEPEPDFFDLGPLACDAPPVTLTSHREVVVHGASNLLTAHDAILAHPLLDLSREVLAEEHFERLSVSEDRASAAWTPTDPFDVGYLPEAAAFTDGVSFNYAHWLTEILPRIVAFTRDGQHVGVPLVIDSQLHANLARSIAMVAGPEVVVYRLRPDQLVRVGLMHNVSPSAHLAFKHRPAAQDAIGHGVFHAPLLRETIERLRRASTWRAPRGARPKLFIRRRSSARHVVSQTRIEEALISRGFIMVQPERLTLDEQVGLYSSAGMVVASTGGAMANLVFCPPDCPTVVMIPKFRQTAYWYWRQMAAAAASGPVIHVSGAQIDPDPDPFSPIAAHADFDVAMEDFWTAIDAAEAFRRAVA